MISKTGNRPSHYNGPTISNHLLTRFANLSAQEQMGDFDAVTRAQLAVALPEICNELLKRRQQDADRAKHKQRQRRDYSLGKARNIIRAVQKHSHRRVVSACETVLRQSPNIKDRAIATGILAQAQRGA